MNPVFSMNDENQDDSESQEKMNVPRGKRVQKLSETKHIVKNYGRCILKFALTHKELMVRLMEKKQVHILNFLKFCKKYKRKLVTIKQLRSLWNDEECIYAKLFRIISAYYLRKYSPSHIFNSRIVNYRFNLKYRAKLFQALSNPQEFTQIKFD